MKTMLPLVTFLLLLLLLPPAVTAQEQDSCAAWTTCVACQNAPRDDPHTICWYENNQCQAVPRDAPHAYPEEMCENAPVMPPGTTIIPVQNLQLPPGAANQIRSLEGYLSGVGYIDLSLLTFLAIDSYNNKADAFALDIAVVRVPDEVCADAPTNSSSPAQVVAACPQTQWQTALGLGTADASLAGGWRWCCNGNQASTWCGENPAPHLMVNPTVMDGTVRQLSIDPSRGSVSITPPEDAEFVVHEGGYYVIVLMNCDTTIGEPVVVNGEAFIVDLQQEIQQQVDEDAPFYGLISVAYFCLFFWFASLMHQHKESRIVLEEWIFAAISVALSEVMMRFFEYVIWKRTGHRIAAVAFMAAVAYGAKHGISRGLLVVLCLGLGVVQPVLAPFVMTTLTVLTVSYISMSTAFDYLAYVQESREADVEGLYDESSLAKTMWLLFCGTAFVDLIFLVWIPTALSGTMASLRETNQERKLLRFRWLYHILVTAVSFTLLVLMAAMLDLFLNQGRLSNGFNLSQVNELNVLFVLGAIAWLWRPNPNARDYAYVTELAGGEHPDDLELTETTATSVVESSDTTYQAFPIESAEAT